MNPKFLSRAAVGLTALIAFAGTGYLGYRFIRDVGQSAESIESRVGPRVIGDVAVNSETLSSGRDAGTFAGRFEALPAPDGVSSGQDVLIGAGELVYQDGRPIVRVKLANHGGFSVSGVFLSFSLYLDKSEEAAAQAAALPVPFDRPLPPGGDTVVNVPVDSPQWRTPTVERAASRRVLAQVVGVSDGDRDNADYPQLSPGVFLSQTQNNWTQPAAASSVVQEQPLQELRPASAASPNILVEAEGAEAAADEEPLTLEQARELLHPQQPQGEPRILSVEVHEYERGGEGRDD